MLSHLWNEPWVIPMNSEERLLGIHCFGRKDNTAFGGWEGFDKSYSSSYTLGFGLKGSWQPGKCIQQAKAFMGNGQWTEWSNTGLRGIGEGKLMAGEWVEGKVSRLKTWAQMPGFPSHLAKKTLWHVGQASVWRLVGGMCAHTERCVTRAVWQHTHWLPGQNTDTIHTLFNNASLLSIYPHPDWPADIIVFPSILPELG